MHPPPAGRRHEDLPRRIGPENEAIDLHIGRHQIAVAAAAAAAVVEVAGLMERLEQITIFFGKLVEELGGQEVGPRAGGLEANRAVARVLQPGGFGDEREIIVLHLLVQSELDRDVLGTLGGGAGLGGGRGGCDGGNAGGFLSKSVA